MCQNLQLTRTDLGATDTERCQCCMSAAMSHSDRISIPTSTFVLLVMVDVANDNGEQTEEDYNAGCVDDRVQGLDAWREILHSAEIL